MLKRIPKSQDIEFRGRLHILLSKILRLCHISGMVKHDVSTVTTGAIDEAQKGSPEVDNTFEKKLITHKFYTRFWGIQKYFSNPALTLFSDTKDPITEEDAEEDNINKKLSTTKLRWVGNVIAEILRIFSNNPVQEFQQSESHQPVKYLTGENLLETQLNDPYFRRLLMVQGLFFCFNLTNTATKNPFPITED